MEFKLGELFSGPGGLALGAGWAGKVRVGRENYSIKHAWGVDKDEQAIETYRSNVVKQFGGRGVCSDANEFCRQIADNPDAFRIDALAFGFPCNDYSNVGEKKGLQGQYGNLYKAGIEVIKQYNPHWFIAENVSGIHSDDSGRTFLNILHELENSGDHGYKLTVNLYKFEQYGVPQSRHRYIIVGIRNDWGLKFEVPAPTHGENLQSYVTASQALKKITSAKKNCELTRQSARVVMRLKFTPPWHNAWYLDDLLKMSVEDRRGVLIGLPWYRKEFSNLTDAEILDELNYARLQCTKARMSHIYKRLHPNKPAYTITGSGGGGTHVYHWREHRALTNRERASLQSFPNFFHFKGSKEQVRKQIGMAVPPRGAKIIFKAILKTFAGIGYPTIEPTIDLENHNVLDRLMAVKLDDTN